MDISIFFNMNILHTGVSIRLMGQELTSGISRVCLSDIGEQLSQANASDGIPDTVEGPALVCVTNNPNCCRPVDNPNGGAVGEWRVNEFPVPGMNENPPSRIYRNRGTGLLRINYRPNVEGADLTTSVIGEYCCTIPDMSGVFQTLCVDVTSEPYLLNKSLRIFIHSSNIIIIDDTICNSDTTSNQLPPVTLTGMYSLK